MSWPERLQPINPSANTVVKDEEKKVQTHATSETEDVDRKNRLDPKRYSSWTRLVRVTAWIKRFIKNCKSPSQSQNMSRVLQNSEFDEARTFWLRKAQTDSFPDKVKDKSPLGFSPFLDKDGLLRVDG
ncbi:Hypothetical predicted protein [Paramuricea clavata]|uniref:Uncharacterized protein n=1 Tax=Paramuricea clavata TaxID=317549 RepID=A0A6S7H9D6_PARCT|nr:Hypothetical predicted protein [Paramuricea clavata]